MTLPMEARYYAIVQALARHALYAVADLPNDHAQRRIVRHQVERLILEFGQRYTSHTNAHDVDLAIDAGGAK